MFGKGKKVADAKPWEGGPRVVQPDAEAEPPRLTDDPEYKRAADTAMEIASRLVALEAEAVSLRAATVVEDGELDAQRVQAAAEAHGRLGVVNQQIHHFTRAQAAAGETLRRVERQAGFRQGGKYAAQLAPLRQEAITALVDAHDKLSEYVAACGAGENNGLLGCGPGVSASEVAGVFQLSLNLRDRHHGMATTPAA